MTTCPKCGKALPHRIYPKRSKLALWFKSLGKEAWDNLKYYDNLYVFGSATNLKLWAQHYQEFLDGERPDPPDLDILVVDESPDEEEDEEDLYYEPEYDEDFDIQRVVVDEFNDGDIKGKPFNSDDTIPIDIWHVFEKHGKLHVVSEQDWKDDLSEEVTQNILNGKIDMKEWVNNMQEELGID